MEGLALWAGQLTSKLAEVMPSKRKIQQKMPLHPTQFLTAARVKAIAKQDESIGKITAEAVGVIARCADAFLADLVTVTAVKAKTTEGDRDKQRLPSTKAIRQVLPEDVRKAVLDEERFDFLRPLLASPPQGAASAKGSSSGPKRTSRATTSGQGNPPKRKKAMDDNAPESPSQPGQKPASFNSALKRADLLALAGLDNERRRAVLLGGVDERASAASILCDDDEEDYDI